MTQDLLNIQLLESNNEFVSHKTVKTKNNEQWIQSNCREISSLLAEEGLVLIRGLRIHASKKLEDLLRMIFGDELLDYQYRSTPRTKVRGRIFTSSEYHPDQVILLHSENSYSNKWPMRIAFYCMNPSSTGGQTPIANNRTITAKIPGSIKTKFGEKKLLYVRNYGDVDLSWSEVFQTTSKLQVENFCRNNNIEFEWTIDGLRTKQLNEALRVHPETMESLWFNQAHLFHISSQDQEIRQNLIRAMGLEGLPRNVYYGDGKEIEDKVITTIREVYEENKAIFDWKKGDLLLLDNMLFSHGRLPYTGARRILTGMSGTINAP